MRLTLVIRDSSFIKIEQHCSIRAIGIPALECQFCRLRPNLRWTISLAAKEGSLVSKREIPDWFEESFNKLIELT